MSDQLGNNEQEKLDQLLNNMGQPEGQPAPPVADPLASPEPMPMGTPEPMAPPIPEPMPMTPPVPEPMGAPIPEPMTPPVPEPMGAPAPEPMPMTPPAPEPMSAPEPMPMTPPIPEPMPMTPPAPEPMSAPEPMPMTPPAPEPMSAPEPMPMTPPVPEPMPMTPPAPEPMPMTPPAPEPMGAPAPEPMPMTPPVPEPMSAPEPADPIVAAPAAMETAALSDDDLPEAMDILSAISVVDPDMEEEANSANIMDRVRTGAKLQQSEGKKKQKIKIEPLPFHQLIRGTPLIATVYSPSGGVGKSSSAMNMGAYIAHVAATMARDKQKSGEENVHVPRVLILDGDIVQGSLGLRLKNQLEPSIHGLQLYIDERRNQGFSGDKAWPRYYETAPAGEKSMLDFVLWSEAIPNLNVLAAPPEPDYFYDLGAEDYRDILRMLGSFYDVIIIDSGTDIVLESQRSWLAHAHEVFIITVPELDRIYNSRKAVTYMAKARPHPLDTRPDAPMLPPLATSERISVVMTKYDADSGLDSENLFHEFFRWLDKRQKFRIPDLGSSMMRANNYHDFLVLENAEYRSEIARMSKHLFSRYAENRQRRTMEPGQGVAPTPAVPMNTPPQAPQPPQQ